jgi:hypothetical protein
LPPGHEVSSFASSVRCHHSPKAIGSTCHGLEPPRLWGKQTFCLCKFIVLGIRYNSRNLTNILVSPNPCLRPGLCGKLLDTVDQIFTALSAVCMVTVTPVTIWAVVSLTPLD